MSRRAAISGLALIAACASVQQVDPAFTPAITNPAHEAGHGPVVWIDQAHNNIVSAKPDSRYAPFVAALRADGYTVRAFAARFDAASLRQVHVLVVGNALHDRNVKDWSLPTPSALGADEIRALSTWVHEGGRLLFVFDHMPAAGAASAPRRDMPRWRPWPHLMAQRSKPRAPCP
jgi:hypothetical protein